MLQLGLACATFLVIAFAPPAIGRTLLVPIAGAPIGKHLLDQAALTRLGPGPLPNSVVVEGRGRVLAASLFDRGISCSPRRRQFVA